MVDTERKLPFGLHLSRSEFLAMAFGMTAEEYERRWTEISHRQAWIALNDTLSRWEKQDRHVKVSFEYGPEDTTPPSPPTDLADPQGG